jgi:hypothetical protein
MPASLKACGSEMPIFKPLFVFISLTSIKPDWGADVQNEFVPRMEPTGVSIGRFSMTSTLS